MNCESLQEHLYEYLDGTLPPDQMSAAEKHLLTCTTCRQVVQNERVTAQTLSGQLKDAAEQIELDAVTREDITRAARLRLMKVTKPWERPHVPFWIRMFWPAMAAGMVLVIGALLEYRFLTAPDLAIAHIPTVRVVPVHVSYSAPSYVFHRDGAQVVDALTSDTRTMDGALIARK